MSDPLTLTLEVVMGAVKVLGAVAPDALEALRVSNGKAIDDAIVIARTAMPPRWDTTQEDAARRRALEARIRAAAEDFASQFKLGDRVRFDRTKTGTVEEINPRAETMTIAWSLADEKPELIIVPFAEIKKL